MSKWKPESMADVDKAVDEGLIERVETKDFLGALENATLDQVEPMLVVFGPGVPREYLDKLVEGLTAWYKSLGGTCLETTITLLPDGSHRLESIPKG